MAFALFTSTGERSLELPHGRSVVVGRSLGCDLPVREPTVSRQHAELAAEPGGVRVHDLGSTNGTFVNGERVTEKLARPGDTIAFGKAAFELREERATGPDGPQPGFDEGSLDATILRQLPLRPSTDVTSAGVVVESTADRQARRLSLLVDIAKALSRQSDIDRMLEKVVALTFQVMDADRVAVLMLTPGDRLVPRVWRSRLPGPAVGWQVPHAIVRKAVEERSAILIDNAPADERFEEGARDLSRIKSAITAPLISGEGRVLGVIYLDNLTTTHSFDDDDLEFLSAFAGLAAVAVENSQLVERVRREAVVLSNFQRYFAPELAEQIAAQRSEVQLGGTRRRVVVLFSDIRGFTTLSERLPPDEVASLLNEYFTEMVEVVFEHGGTLDKFMGDALMALWGAPLARPDDADRAVATAVAMERTLAGLNRSWHERGRPSLAAGIGLAVGEVFAGNIGSDRRLEYTVLGDAVNTAARLCAEAGPGEILMTDTLYRELASPPPAIELPALTLRGKSHPVPVLRVEWDGAAPDADGRVVAGRRGVR